MEAGSSQAEISTQKPPHESSEKKRKPRHKLKKGKEREDDRKPELEAQGVSNVPEVNESSVEDVSTWTWAPLSDTYVSSRPPVFTNDWRYFFLIAGSSVKIYATATGQVVSTLSSASSGSASSSSHSADSHTDEITAALINPQNAFQLMTASLDGQIKVWDYLEAVLLSTIEVGEPITHMCTHEQMRDHVIVATPSRKRVKKGVKQSKVYRVSLRPSSATAKKPVYIPQDKFKIGKMECTTGLAISPSGTWLVATGGTKAYVCSTASLASGFTKFVSNEMLTCLAFHPTEEYFATGDHKGQIRLWYCLDPAQVESRFQGERRAQTTTLHWHAHAVSSIAFTANGSYLLSGGEEAVLVIWQLHTGKKEFVPRVGAPIVSVVVASHQTAEEEFLLVLSDGTLAFVGSGSLQITRSYSRIKHDPNYPASASASAPLAVHTRTSTLLLPSSHPSSLLIYAPLRSTLLVELEVSPSNRISRRDELPIEPSRVERAVISEDGGWLATIDGREGGEDFPRQTYLKIWQWDPASSTWDLNSRIDRPHGLHRVTTLTFTLSEGHPFLVTTGYDGNAKVWRIKSASNKKGEQEVFWVCRSTLAYRSQNPTAAVCSPDGSLLAVAYGSQTVVYEFSNSVLRIALTFSEVKQVTHLAFLGPSGRYIFVGGPYDVILWDLVTSSVRWHHTFPGRICHVVPHPKHDACVVMYRGTYSRPTAIQILNVASATPISSRTLPFELRSVVWYPYTAWGNDFTLVGITQKWSSVVLGDRIDLPHEEGSLARGISEDTKPRRGTLFEDIFGPSAFQDFSPQAQAISSTDRHDVANPVKSSNPLSAPAYLLPPLHTLITPLVESLLQQRIVRPASRTNEEPEHVEEDDIFMEDASPPRTSGRVLRDEEMDEFIELFKEQSFSSTQSKIDAPKSTSLNGNGVVKAVNGTHRHKAVSIGSQAPTTINGRNHHPKSPVEPTLAQHSSPVVVGKKRKKSTG